MAVPQLPEGSMFLAESERDTAVVLLVKHLPVPGMCVVVLVEHEGNIGNGRVRYLRLGPWSIREGNLPLDLDSFILHDHIGMVDITGIDRDMALRAILNAETLELVKQRVRYLFK